MGICKISEMEVVGLHYKCPRKSKHRHTLPRALQRLCQMDVRMINNWHGTEKCK